MSQSQISKRKGVLKLISDIIDLGIKVLIDLTCDKCLEVLDISTSGFLIFPSPEVCCFASTTPKNLSFLVLVSECRKSKKSIKTFQLCSVSVIKPKYLRYWWCDLFHQSSSQKMKTFIGVLDWNRLFLFVALSFQKKTEFIGISRFTSCSLAVARGFFSSIVVSFENCTTSRRIRLTKTHWFHACIMFLIQRKRENGPVDLTNLNSRNFCFRNLWPDFPFKLSIYIRNHGDTLCTSYDIVVVFRIGIGIVRKRKTISECQKISTFIMNFFLIMSGFICSVKVSIKFFH